MNKLSKLMMLTTSTNDNEALAALRKANAILAAQSVSWDEFLKGMKNLVIQEEPKAPKKKKDESDIKEMLQTVLASHLSDTGYEFISSLNAFFTEKNFLTEKQEKALRKFYDNIINRS